MKQTRTATGSAILARLAASTMLDGVTDGRALEMLYDTYDYELPGVIRMVHDFIRKCGISKVSKRTIKLAEIAVDYFNNTERKVEMDDKKKLYIPCPMCDEMMDYKECDEEDADIITYECRVCGCSITASISNIEEYSSIEARSRGVYAEQDCEPAEEQEELYYAELGNEDFGD